MERLTQYGLNNLPPQERLALITELWESLDSDQVPLTAAQREELDRRFATLEEDTAAGTSWEELKAEMERRYP